MLYREMPRVKEKLSILGYGCMRLPTKDGQIDESAAARMIRTAVDNGINYIDTARPYHGGTSEPFVGRALKGLRDKVKLATKLPSWAIEKREDMDFHLNEQLEQLQTDHIDFYLLHGLSAARWEKLSRLGAMEFMEKARAAGKIRYISFSFHDGLDTFKKIVDAYPWDMCQIQLNFIDDNYQAGLEGMRYAYGKKVGVVVMEPLKGGSISVAVPKDIEAQAKAAGYNEPELTELGLRWVWHQPEVSVVLSGMTAPSHLEQNTAIAAKGLPNSLNAKELELAKTARDFFINRMKVPCTSCSYCKPCPQNVDIPQCFTLMNNAALSGDWEGMRKSYAYLFGKSPLERGANYCVECGACEPQCPQNIPIRAKLKEVHAALGA